MTGFNSPTFLFLFLPAFLAVFLLSPKRFKGIVGILASLVFYAWGNLLFLPLMLALILVNYWIGLRLAAITALRQKRFWIWAGVGIDIGVLVFFKRWSAWGFPLGLSYISFQLVSYLADINKKTLEAESDLAKFALYILLFPKILVGPITRYGPLKDQLGSLRPSPNQVAAGIRRFIFGLAKKVLIADFLGRVTTPVFSMARPDIEPGLAWFVLLSFAVQLYFDFSGLTDMALGLGNMMGLNLPENFNFPYISKSISEFWRRWHISLSSWFRDYVFYPLERRRLKWIGQPVNILIVFGLTGLWHGLALHYLAWGLVHGSAIVFENSALGRKLRTLWAPLQHVYALSVILLSWVFFRAPSVKFALRFLIRLAGDTRGLSPLRFDVTSPLPIIDPSVVLAFALGILFCLPIAKWLSSLLGRWVKVGPLANIFLQAIGYVAVLFLYGLSLAALVSSTFSPGIYAKF